jgi:tetratricopeptide (TPR) repeat protein
MKVETSSDYLQRGWLYLSSHQLELAAQDFRHILETEAENIEALYGLGLTLKADGKKEPAVESFERILGLLPKIQDSQRASVLSRLVKGHINLMKTGDWNLEKEVWQRKK